MTAPTQAKPTGSQRTRDSAGVQIQGPQGAERRGWWGWLLQHLLGPLYYWLDLYDVNRRPSHSKLKTTGVLIVAVALTIGVATYTFTSHGSVLALFGYIVLVVFASYGLAGLKVWAYTKGGGTSEVLTEVAKAEPARLVAESVLEQTRAEIQSRRDLGGDYEPS